jgi:hypothetical protein
MVHSIGEERAVHLTREAVELADAGHREVSLLIFMPSEFLLFCFR